MDQSIKFSKYQGCGNDFVIIDNREKVVKEEDVKDLVIKLCSRKFSVGADGVIFIEKSKDYDFRFKYHDGDGTEATMCGNGSRCAVKFAYLNGIADKEMDFEIKEGHMKASTDGELATVNFPPVKVSEFKTERTIEVDGEEYTYTYVYMTNDQVMVFCEEMPSQEDIIRIGSQMRYNKEHFPKGANINFVVKRDDDNYEIITYERGNEDICLACGTASTATAATVNVLYGQEAPINIKNIGGDITMNFTNDGKHIKDIAMTGNAVHVFDGVLV